MSTTLPGDYPRQHESWVKLKNGREVFIRPILPTDGPLVLDLFHRMSPASLALRFLKPLDVLPDDLLYRLTHLDYQSTFALGAIVQEDERDALVAVARYADEPDSPADLAVAVRDDWQQLGLGKWLLARILAIGKAHGLSRIGSLMDPQNSRMKQMLSRLGYPVSYSVRSGFFQVEITVD
jgi:acetyltransferase